MNIIRINPDTYYPCSQFTKSTGFTSLMYLFYHTRDHPEYLEQIKYISDNNPEELDKQNDSGWTALMISCRNSNSTSTLDTVKLLLEYHPDVNLCDKYKCSILLYALVFSDNDSHPETCKLLLKHGANVNIIDKDGDSILMSLIKQSMRIYDLIEYVLENSDVDLDYKKNDKTVYDYAVKYNKRDIAELIKKYQDNSLDIKCALD